VKNNHLKSLVIGAGSIGLRHIDVLDNIGHRTAILTNRSDINLLTFTNIQDALKKFEPDYIIIANDTNKHIKELRRILNYGYNKKILIEKPITNNLKEISFLNKLTKNIFVGYNMRYHPFIKFIKKLLLDEKILSANIYVGQYLPNWRPNRDYRKTYSSDYNKGGGVLLELSHELDYLLFLFGKCIQNFSLIGKLSNLEINCQDSVVGIFEFERCQQISYNFNLLDKLGRREIILNTDKNTFKFDLVRNSISTNDNIIKYDLNRNETYKNMHLDILNNKGKNACTYNESIEVLDLINKII